MSSTPRVSALWSCPYLSILRLFFPVSHRALVYPVFFLAPLLVHTLRQDSDPTAVTTLSYAFGPHHSAATCVQTICHPSVPPFPPPIRSAVFAQPYLDATTSSSCLSLRPSPCCPMHKTRILTRSDYRSSITLCRSYTSRRVPYTLWPRTPPPTRLRSR